MTRRATPTPDPSAAADIGQGAIHGAIFTGVILPVVQHIAWMLLVHVPNTTELSLGAFAGPVGLYFIVLGLLPPLLTVGSLIEAYGGAGVAGVIAYLFVSLWTSSLFSNPQLSMVMIMSTVFALFLYLSIKAMGSQGSRRSHYR